MATKKTRSGTKKSTSKKTATKKSGSKKSTTKKATKGQRKVAKVMREQKRGELKSGRSGKKVTNRKQAIAIALSEARKSGAKIPKKKARKS